MRSTDRVGGPLHRGLRCFCCGCGSRWWATALAVIRNTACPWCGADVYNVREETE